MESYKIMHKNDIVAETEGLTVTRLVKPVLCPVLIKEGSNIVPWIALRSVDMHRTKRLNSSPAIERPVFFAGST